MRFTPETDPTDWPGNGKLTSGRMKGKGTTYGPGGPSGGGGDSNNAGPNGTTNGPAGQRITGFHGKPNVSGPKAWPQAREHMKPKPLT